MREGCVIEAYADGVCEPRNPGGHAAWGALVKVNGIVEYSEGGYVGCGPTMSNNVAEYTGFIAAAQWLLTSDLQGCVIFRADSKLVICQLNKEWRVRGGYYLPFYNTAVKLLEELRRKFQGNIKLQWVPRSKNSQCDVLSKQVLLDRGIKFKIQPMEKQ